MKHQKMIIVVLNCLVFVSLVGCNFNSIQSSEKQNKKAEGDQVQVNYLESDDLIHPEPLPPVKNDVFVERMPPPKKEDFYTIITDIEEYEIEKALSQVIEYHNDKEKTSIPFPIFLKLDESISKEVEIDGEITVLEVTADAKKKNNEYIINLTQDWKLQLDGVEATSYWQYTISEAGIELLDKKEDGKWVEEKWMLE